MIKYLRECSVAALITVICSGLTIAIGVATIVFMIWAQADLRHERDAISTPIWTVYNRDGSFRDGPPPGLTFYHLFPDDVKEPQPEIRRGLVSDEAIRRAKIAAANAREVTFRTRAAGDRHDPVRNWTPGTHVIYAKHGLSEDDFAKQGIRVCHNGDDPDACECVETTTENHQCSIDPATGKVRRP